MHRSSGKMVISTQIDGSDRRDVGMPRSGGGSDSSRTSMRAKRVLSAQRHSRTVRLLRRLLPLCALGVIGYYAATLIAASDIGGQMALKAIPKILPTDLTMHNPSYRGYTKDGGAYVVRAKTAKQDAKLNKHILLTKVSGDLTQKSGTTLKLQADDGTFDTESEGITLRNNVSLTSSSGAWARLETVSIDNRTGLITSDQPVEFGNPRATIKGRNLQIKR
ncbi:MAG: LPS export ABC transporter periplasmic protein LptC, partial [Hyphomicrobiaceae bacterium]